MYEGDKPCPGCGRPGSECARPTKDGLCHDCQQQLSIGRAIAKERSLERNFYRLDDLVIGEMTWYTIRLNEISRKVVKLLKTFSAFDSRYALRLSANDGQLAGKISSTARDRFVLPRVTFDAAKELCESLRVACDDLEEEKRGYRKRLDAELAEQKNEIFNKGVERGRNLLFQLNSGQITLADLNRKIKEY